MRTSYSDGDATDNHFVSTATGPKSLYDRRDLLEACTHGTRNRSLSSPPQISPDGRHFWDGQSWREISPDRRSWWDGTIWRPVVPAIGPTVGAQYSPDGRFQWTGTQWIPTSVPRSGGWWWNGMQWVPALTPVHRAFRRLGFKVETLLVGCALFGLFFILAAAIALHSR